MKEEIPKHLTKEASAIVSNNNVWDEFKERITTPFFSSFIISWIGFNWKIIILLFWYKREDIKASGFESLLDILKANSNWLNTLWYPVIFSFLYVLTYPIIRDFIKVPIAWVKSLTNGWILNASKKAKVDMHYYLELRNVYVENQKKLESEFSDGLKFRNENDKLKTRILELEKTINENSRQSNEFAEISNLSNWLGYYNMEILFEEAGSKGFDESKKKYKLTFRIIEIETTKKIIFNIVWLNPEIRSRAKPEIENHNEYSLVDSFLDMTYIYGPYINHSNSSAMILGLSKLDYHSRRHDSKNDIFLVLDGSIYMGSFRGYMIARDAKSYYVRIDRQPRTDIFHD